MSQNVLNQIWKNPRICPIWGQSDPLWALSGHRATVSSQFVRFSYWASTTRDRQVGGLLIVSWMTILLSISTQSQSRFSRHGIIKLTVSLFLSVKCLIVIYLRQLKVCVCLYWRSWSNHILWHFFFKLRNYKDNGF